MNNNYNFEVLTISPKSGEVVLSRQLHTYDLNRGQVIAEARRLLASVQAVAKFDGEPVFLTCNGEVLFSHPKYTGRRVNKL